MGKRCPECGLFMALETFGEAGMESIDSYLWWSCGNEYCLQHDRGPLPAPEYQWLWDGHGIPEQDLAEWPELLEECRQLWDRLPESYKKRYKRHDPHRIAPLAS